eukprot:scaffold3156_cov105-Isochrysis_galbana.AAC.1
MSRREAELEEGSRDSRILGVLQRPQSPRLIGQRAPDRVHGTGIQRVDPHHARTKDAPVQGPTGTRHDEKPMTGCRQDLA